MEKYKGKVIFGSITPLSSIGKRYYEIFNMSKEELSKLGFKIIPMFWDKETTIKNNTINNEERRF